MKESGCGVLYSFISLAARNEIPLYDVGCVYKLFPGIKDYNMKNNDLFPSYFFQFTMYLRML